MTAIFPNGPQGLSDTKWSGVKGSCADIVGIDYRSTPGIFKAHQKLSKDSGVVIDELCKSSIDMPDGTTLWFSSESGKVWKEDNGTYTLEYTVDINAGDLKWLYSLGENAIPLDPSTGNPDRAQVIFFKPDGLTAIYSDQRYLRQIDLTEAFNLNTASFPNKSIDTNPQTDSRILNNFYVNDAGTRLYVCGSGTSVYQYNLSTGWDVSTASYSSTSFNHGKDGNPGVTFS